MAAAPPELPQNSAASQPSVSCAPPFVRKQSRRPAPIRPPTIREHENARPSRRPRHDASATAARAADDGWDALHKRDHWPRLRPRVFKIARASFSSVSGHGHGRWVKIALRPRLRARRAPCGAHVGPGALPFLCKTRVRQQRIRAGQRPQLPQSLVSPVRQRFSPSQSAAPAGHRMAHGQGGNGSPNFKVSGKGARPKGRGGKQRPQGDASSPGR